MPCSEGSQCNACEPAYRHQGLIQERQLDYCVQFRMVPPQYLFPTDTREGLDVLGTYFILSPSGYSDASLVHGFH